MTRIRRKTKYVHEGHYVAEVDVELMDDDSGWSPYLSVADARKLDDVKTALRNGDFEIAAKHGRIYELKPVVSS